MLWKGMTGLVCIDDLFVHAFEKEWPLQEGHERD